MADNPPQFITFRDLHRAKPEPPRPASVPALSEPSDHNELNYSGSVRDHQALSAYQTLSDQEATDSVPLALSDQQTLSANPSQSDQLALQISGSGTTAIPNLLLDGIFPTLRVQDQIVYLRLFRLSHGFHAETCKVGYEKLATSCNLSRREVIRSIERLELAGLIKRLGCDFRTPSTAIRANLYQVFIPQQRGAKQSLSAKQSPSAPKSLSAGQSPNKHDHDDLKRNHHQKAQAPQKDDDPQPNTPHFQHVKTTYQQITGNPWSAKDTKTYAEIAAIPPETVEAAIRVAFSRAPAPPRSLAYFIPEIKTQHQPPKANRAANKRQLREIAEEVRTRFVGHPLTMSEFSEQIKHLAANRGINYGGGVLTEVLEELQRNHTGS